MSRRKSRTKALELIYEQEFYNDLAPEELLEHATLYREESYDDFTKELFFGVSQHKLELDEMIEKAADNWKLNRINKITLGILRMCVYEIVYIAETDIPVIINEALELAKEYDDEKAVPFINGVIGRIVNK